MLHCGLWHISHAAPTETTAKKTLDACCFSGNDRSIIVFEETIVHNFQRKLLRREFVEASNLNTQCWNSVISQIGTECKEIKHKTGTDKKIENYANYLF